MTPNEDEICVKVKLVRQPHFVQGDDNHRAAWLLLYPARSSLRGGKSVEARIKVPVGSMIAGGGEPLAGSQGCVYLGSALSPLACLPSRREMSASPQCGSSGRGPLSAPHSVVLQAGEADPPRGACCSLHLL